MTDHAKSVVDRLQRSRELSSLVLALAGFGAMLLLLFKAG
jgi:hypothetical protein